MNFWDTSALVPLFVQEARTEQAGEWYAREEHILVAHHARTECTSAICRLEREGHLDPGQVSAILERLHHEASTWHRVDMSSQLERLAIRCLRVHPLQAMDALHLASALLIAGGDPSTCLFHTLDQGLADAAAKEGFRLI